MPYRQNGLSTHYFQRKQTVQFVLGPVLIEERQTQHNDAKTRLGEATFDRPAKAIADLKRGLVKPDLKATRLQPIGDTGGNMPILARVAYEHVPHGWFCASNVLFCGGQRLRPQ